MDFPKDKMDFVASHGDHASEKGWLILNVGAMDLEGITRIYISLDAVEELKGRGERHADVLQRMRSLLGG